MRKIAFANQKGGVGKSTSCINIAAILGDMGYRVLVIDLDPQGNCTLGFGIEEKNLEEKLSAYDVLLKNEPIENVITETNYLNVDIIPSYIILANADIELTSVMSRETILMRAIKKSFIDYDYILLDLPPNLGLLSVNGLVAANDVLIPLDVGSFAISGVKQLIKTLNLIKDNINPYLNILGVLLTKVDGRTNIAKERRKDLNDIFGDKFFNTVIHNNVKIPESQQYGKPLIYYDSNCRGAIEYKNATKELIDKYEYMEA